MPETDTQDSFLHSASSFPAISHSFISLTYSISQLLFLLFPSQGLHLIPPHTVTFIHITFILPLPFPSHSPSLSFFPFHSHLKALTISFTFPHSVTLVHIALTLPHSFSHFHPYHSHSLPPSVTLIHIALTLPPDIHLRVLISRLILFGRFLFPSTQLL